MDDQEIMRFTTLWARAQPSVFAFISSAITNFADAEDVLQQVAASSVRKFSEYDASRPFLNWSIGVARLEILRHLRDKATDRHQFVAEAIEHIAQAFETLAPELEARGGALSECMKHVEGRQRDVLTRRYSEGLSMAAIAQSLGLTSGNVSVILHRTIRKLRECIDGKMSADGAN